MEFVPEILSELPAGFLAPSVLKAEKAKAKMAKHIAEVTIALTTAAKTGVLKKLLFFQPVYITLSPRSLKKRLPVKGKK